MIWRSSYVEYAKKFYKFRTSPIENKRGCLVYKTMLVRAIDEEPEMKKNSMKEQLKPRKVSV